MKPETNIDLRKRAADFAGKRISGRTDLQTGGDFPRDIWNEMGEAGLFGIGIAEEYGGTAGGYADLWDAGESFVKSGRNLGLAVSWLYQQIIAHYILGVFGTREQREHYLPAAARGKITFSFAVSEPGHGARPKLLTTLAGKQEDGFTLTGEKTYLTNGPIAGLFIVVAVTDDQTPQKRFTAFLVPRTADGVAVAEPLPLNFLKPSPHGGVKLTNCAVGRASVLGTEGNAWKDLVVPFGEIEDVVMTGPALGGMSAVFAGLTAALRERSSGYDPSLPGELGAANALLESLRVLGRESAGRLDRGGESTTALMIAFARQAAEFQAGLRKIIDTQSIALPDPYVDLLRDLDATLALKRKLMQIRQEKIGAAVIKS